MRKLIITGMAVAMLAVPAAASADYSVPETASYSGAAHGTFGALGEQGARHDLGQGDNATNDGGHLGANPLTGLSNASVMGNGTPEPHVSKTPLR